MTTTDEQDESVRVEHDLRRQLRWIEDDVMIALRGPDQDADPEADHAGGTLKRLTDAFGPTTARFGIKSAIMRVRRWSTALLGRVGAKR